MVRSGDTDAAMVDEALRAWRSHHRSTEVEASCTAYDEHPLDDRTSGVTWRRSAKQSDGPDRATRTR